MCRLAAFPPNYPREQALEIMLAFEKNNTDGVGSVHVKNGKFVVDKHPFSLSKLLSKKNNFLGHMENGHDGWTLAHLRLASHGNVAMKNTHPFIIGDWGFVHNGVWGNYKLVRLALSKTVKFEGETDTEVAGHLWNIIGPKKFSDEIDYGGVFMGLHRNGQLQVVKASGDLEVFPRKNRTVLLASELPNEYKRKVDASRGWYHYDKNGMYIAHKAKAHTTYFQGYTAGSTASSYFGPKQPPTHGGAVGRYTGGGEPVGFKAGCSGGSCSTSGKPKEPVSQVFADTDFSRIGEDEEWQRQVNRELAEQLGISEEETGGIPDYTPRQGGALGLTHNSLDEEENWRNR